MSLILLKIFNGKAPARAFFFVCLALACVSCRPRKETIAQPSFINNKAKPEVADTALPDYFQSNFFRYDDYVYKANIKSVQLRIAGWLMSENCLELGSTQIFELCFDDLDGDLKNYSYTIIHCDANWKPSELQPNEYMEGFQENYIKNYQYSFNTIQKYTHYKLFFPNQNFRFTKSGNYLLKVYIENEPDNVVITRRFTIYEKLVDIAATVKKTSEVDKMEQKQQVHFRIVQNNFKINYPEKLTVVLSKNDRKDEYISNLKPRFIQGNELIYDWDSGNSFNGGNEFRYFDIQTLKNYTERVAGIDFTQGAYHVHLYPDERRTFKNYFFYEDINGKKLLKTIDAANVDIEGEYVWVHFTLPYPNPIVQGNLYIFGSLTDWNILKEAQMIYDPERICYRGKLYLKQGYYNYHYVLLEDDKKIADETFIEGNHSETQNEYKILVYYREPGQLYDRVIGYSLFPSFPK